MVVDDHDRQNMGVGLNHVVLASASLEIDMWGVSHLATFVMNQGVAETAIGQCAHPHLGGFEVEMNFVE